MGMDVVSRQVVRVVRWGYPKHEGTRPVMNLGS